MKHIFLTLLAALTLVSCQFFETEKISSDEFFDEEIKAIDWEDIDQYPTFPDCEKHTEKLEKKNCFETSLRQYVHRSIGSRNLSTHEDLNDTVLLKFNISKTGEISNLNISLDSLLKQKIPLLEEWFVQSIDSLPKLAPAYKRGIPVETEFTLPVVLKTQ